MSSMAQCSPKESVDPLWLADALAAEGGTLARMDIGIDADAELYEQVLVLSGKAYPEAAELIQKSLASFQEEKAKEKRPAVLAQRRPEDTSRLLLNLLDLLEHLSSPKDRKIIARLISFVGKWPEQYLWEPTEIKNGKHASIRYAELKRRQQEEVNAFPIAFAFDNRQFEEGMRKLGLRPSEAEKVVSIGCGGFIRKSDAETLRELFRRHERQRKIAIAADKTGKGFLLEMFRGELADHEYGYTRDPEPALSALGLTMQELSKDERMYQSFLLACRLEAKWYDEHC